MSRLNHPSADEPRPKRVYNNDQIPARSRYTPARKSHIAPQPSIKGHTVRLVAGSAIGLLVMLALLVMAMKFAERDWSRKHQQARQLGHRPGPAAVETVHAPLQIKGWKHTLSRTATDRQMRRLAVAPGGLNGWLVLARAIPDRDAPRLTLSALRMAMAVGGESATIHNDYGAAYLQQRRMRQAKVHFNAALQIQPGFAPTLFNSALVAIAERQPGRAAELLARYLAQRPDDTNAYRLLATLLTQSGRADEALRLLENFLRDQPPTQPLFLDAAILAARQRQHGNAIRYLETSLNGNPVQSVVRAYQSPAFREIRLSADGTALASRLASRARVAYGAPLPVEEIQPLRGNPEPAAIVR